MASGSITSWQIDGETMETMRGFIFLGSKQYVNRELSDVQAGYRKGKGTRDQIANIRWIIEKVREFQKNISSASLMTLKPLTL